MLITEHSATIGIFKSFQLTISKPTTTRLIRCNALKNFLNCDIKRYTPYTTYMWASIVINV